MRQELQPDPQERPLQRTATQEESPQTVGELEQSVNPQELEKLLSDLRRQSRRHAWLGGLAGLLICLFVASIVIGGVVYGIMSRFEGHAVRLLFDLSLNSFGVEGHSSGALGKAGDATLTVSGLLPLMLLGGSGLFAAMARRERVKLTQSLTHYEDVRAVGPLVEALYLRDRSVRSAAAATLKRLLPRLRAEDADLLDRNQRLMLSLYVGRSRVSLLDDDEDLAVAILEAYRVLGDGSELPAVRRLTQGKGIAARAPRIRAAAQDYLDEVARRKELEQQAQTLLRAADGNRSDPEILLRAASGTPTTSPDQLLRAASGDEPTTP